MLPTPDTGGKLAENLLSFARLLRASGLPIGTGSILQATEAVNLVGLESRADLHACLSSVFLTRHEQQALFDQAFSLFWQNPKIIERMLGAMLPTVQTPQQQDPVSRRLSEALNTGKQPPEEAERSLEFDARFTASDQEVLQQKDFAQMSVEEIAAAKLAMQQLRLPLQEIKSRRFLVDGSGPVIDMRRTLRAAMRQSDTIPLQYKRQRTRNPALVVLCDISGSMSQYSRMFLHFMHAVTNDRDRVYSFVFGTRLSHISRHLAHRDIDVALQKTSEAVEDWSGGTRIGACLGQFNRQWSRRVLSQGGIVLLISDGLDRDEGLGLKQEMDRLSRSCRRLVWLNPLLRYEKFEPKAQGIQAMLPYVDDFVSAHSIKSFKELVEVLSKDGERRAA
ncbi:MAG: VWA domain-containing protein [Pseudomonadales bacterium]|nr:VWA domain-containing protein [Pseudomonadales bacterium]